MKLAKFFAILVFITFSYSCNNSENASATDKDSTPVTQTENLTNATPDFSGQYKLPAESGDLALIITKVGNDFRYNLKGEGGKLDVEGALIVSPEAESFRLTFDGPTGGENKPKDVEALFQNNTIVIQNSGNADQGSWVLFPFCSAKYLEFTKI